MRKILIFISILFFASCNKPNTEVMELVELLKTEKIIASYFQGNKISVLLDEVDQSNNYQNLLKIATDEDLIYLTDNEYPIIRCIAFKGLNSRNNTRIREILYNHKNDNSEVECSNGACLTNQIKVKEFMLEQLNPETTSKYRFSLEKFDSIAKIYEKE
jgi:hypothetical protein